MKFLIAILLTLTLLSVHAGTSRDLTSLLKGKAVIYRGTCHLTTEGLFVNDEADYTVHRCIIGVDQNEPGDIYYALILDDQSKPVTLLCVDKDAGTQTVMWKRGTEI